MREKGRMGRWVWGVVGVAALGVLTGCQGFFIYPGSVSTSSSTSGNIVYVANASTNTLAGFGIGSSVLTAVTNSPYSLAFSPTALAITPSNSFLYVAGTSAIDAYSIGTAGALTAVNSGSAVGLANVVSMDISPDGQWLFALDGNGVTVDEFLINATTGALNQVAGATYSVSGATVVPRSLKVAPNAAYVFVALGTGGDLVLSFNTTSGAIAVTQQLAAPSTTTSDNGLAVNPASSYLYIARSGTGSGLAAYSIGSGGALTSVSGSPFSAGTQPYTVAVNSAGTDVYLANRGDGTISGYSVATSGTLTALTGSPYTSGSAVTALARDSTGTYLLAAANGGTPDLTLYTFDATSTGKLDLATTSSTGIDPTGPVAIVTTH